nr:hypothetical protein [Tanacetum cinerariifolium]
MDTTIEQQVAMDEALVPCAQRLRIGRSNFRLLSDIKSKESTLQLVYDVLNMLHICPRVHGQSFDDPPFEEEILAYIHFLGHSVGIRMLTDVNINKLYQPWRSFAAIINKCLTGKSSGYDSLRLSQAQILNDLIFSTIKLVSRHQNTQQFGALLPIKLTNVEIRKSKAYKEYYAVATREVASKPKDSVRRTKSSSNTSITPPTTAAGPRLTTTQKGKQAAKATKAKSLSVLSKEELLWNSIDDEGADDKGKDGDDDEEDEGDDAEEGDEDIGLNVEREEGLNEEEEEDELYRDTPTSVAPLPITTPTMTSSTIATTTTSQAPILPTIVLIDIIQNLPSFGSLFCFNDRLRSLEDNYSEGMLTNQFAGAISAILGIIQQYIDQRMNDAVRMAIIKEQVKEQVKVKVSKILPRIKQAVNEQLEAEVLTRSSHSSRTFYAVAADISEMELKKILIEKIEDNKSIQCSDEQRNLYKALVEAYESDKIILDTYG